MTQNRILMIVRSGRNSRHVTWCSPDRAYDLHLCAYVPDPPPDDRVDHLACYPGPKWHGLRDYLRDNPGLLDAYDYICFPDDDLEAPPEQMARLCRELLHFRPQLAQPSLSLKSFYSFDVTLHRPFSRSRRVNFVEVMFPCIRTDFLREILWTFNQNTSGWGLEWLWHDVAVKRFGGADFRISDSAVFDHMRPVGSAGSGGALAPPAQEMTDMLARHGLYRFEPQSLNSTRPRRVLWRLYKRLATPARKT